MSVKKPLVLGPDGRPQQLQPGDSLAGGSSLQQVNLTADAAINAGAPVYASAADHINNAQANASTTKEVLGLAVASIANGAAGSVQTSDVLSLSTMQWNTVGGGMSGLTTGAVYFLDPATAGKITSTVPSTAGQYVCEIGLALSTTELQIRIQPPILL